MIPSFFILSYFRNKEVFSKVNSYDLDSGKCIFIVCSKSKNMLLAITLNTLDVLSRQFLTASRSCSCMSSIGSSTLNI